MYKVVSVKDGRYYSAILGNTSTASIFTRDSIYRVEYKIGEFVTPKIGKIFCFEHIDDARTFLNSNHAASLNLLVLFKVEVINPEPFKAKFGNSVKDFWENIDDMYTQYSSFPYGTMVVDSLKLVECTK